MSTVQGTAPVVLQPSTSVDCSHPFRVNRRCLLVNRGGLPAVPFFVHGPCVVPYLWTATLCFWPKWCFAARVVLQHGYHPRRRAIFCIMAARIHTLTRFICVSCAVLCGPILLHFISLHFTSIRFTSLHFTSLHFTSLHFTSLHFTSLHFTLLHFTSLHFTSLHFTSLHFTSLHLCMYVQQDGVM